MGFLFPFSSSAKSLTNIIRLMRKERPKVTSSSSSPTTKAPSKLSK